MTHATRPTGLGFIPIWLIFVPRVPAITIHPKLVVVVRDKKNIYEI